MKIHIKQGEGLKSLNTLILLTKQKKKDPILKEGLKEKNKRIREEVLRVVFR